MKLKKVILFLISVILLVACDGSLLPGAAPEVQVEMDVTGVADSWEWRDVEATPYDNSSPPGPVGLPNHVEITLDGGETVIYVIHVDAYEQLWNDAGDSTVSDRLAQLREIIDSGQVPSTGIQALPVEEASAFNDLAVQGVVAQLGEWNGFRFVGRYEQSANPVLNDDLRYIFQGFSPNGEYLVGVFYPVSTNGVLPETIDEVSAEDMALVESDPQTYMQGQMDALNALAPAEWNPDLSALDAMVASLRYIGPESGPSAGE